jgi:ferric-dicitrate binding protein FerR (iron transport regulator)
LSYFAGKQKNSSVPTLYNTVSTPNGGQYQIILPDGTRVWLNAASSIRFPTSFARERKVTMTGEAYFEVAHNAQLPFVVNVNDKEEVTVLGTHFNINAYDNEKAIRTTLLQGSVKVGNRQSAVGNRQSAILKPGEQAVLIASPFTPPRRAGIEHSPLTIDHSPDLDKVLAWKNGLFNLSGADLKDFMHQVERWYDVTVHYEGAVPNMEFQGKLNRAVPSFGYYRLPEKPGRCLPAGRENTFRKS